MSRKNRIISLIFSMLLICAAMIVPVEAEQVDIPTDNLDELEAPVEELPAPRYLYMCDEIEPGTRLLMGTFEQDGDDSNGKEDIEWTVLDMIDGKALLISTYALDWITYNPAAPLNQIYWDDSGIKNRLDSTFYDEAFAVYEKQIICPMPEAAVTSETKTLYDGTEVTYDDSTDSLVSLLSTYQIERYYPDTADRRCYATNYAAQKSGRQSGTPVMWYLRRSGELTMYGVFASTDGGVYIATEAKAFILTRPVIWINVP